MSKYYNTTPWVIPELPATLVSKLTNLGETMVVEKGQLVTGASVSGQAINANRMVLTTSGLLAQTYVTHDANKPYAISIVLPNRLINYCGFMGIDTSAESVIALRRSQVVCIDIEVLQRLADDDPQLQQALQCYCMQCIASDYDAFTCMFTCDTERRLAHLFSSLLDSVPDTPASPWTLIPVKLSYLELSYVMYTTKKTIERIIPEWKRNNIIRMVNKGYEVNREALRELIF